jgi:hypothetical protein
MASSTWFIIPLHGAKSHNSKLITYDPYDLICQNIIFLNFGISFRDFYFYHGQLYQNAKRLLWPSHSMISP